ncbi:MAG: chorismate mutase [Thermoplasmata archaeon]
MIYFIGSSEDLSVLREEIFENTVSILKLFGVRAKLSERISEIKKNSNIEIRDAGRETEVIRKLGLTDKYTLGILNYLFEFSIDFQTTNSLNLPWGKEEVEGINYNVLSGERNTVELIAGILIGNFGQRAFISGKIPSNFEIGLIMRGSHVISDTLIRKDENICKIGLGIFSEEMEGSITYEANFAKFSVRSDHLQSINSRDVWVIT